MSRLGKVVYLSPPRSSVVLTITAENEYHRLQNTYGREAVDSVWEYLLRNIQKYLPKEVSFHEGCKLGWVLPESLQFGKLSSKLITVHLLADTNKLVVTQIEAHL